MGCDGGFCTFEILLHIEYPHGRNQIQGRILFVKYEDKITLVPLWEKSILTLEEATAYSGAGRNKLVALSDEPDCEFVLWNGSKRMFKRKKLDEFLERSHSI